MIASVKEALVKADALHLQSMEHFDRSARLRLLGQTDDALSSLRLAFKLERDAADQLASLEIPEPSRAIFHKGAASLALQVGEPGEAMRLVARALAGRPPTWIAEELQLLKEAARESKTEAIEARAQISTAQRVEAYQSEALPGGLGPARSEASGEFSVSAPTLVLPSAGPTPTLAQLIAQCAGPSRAECLNALIERLQPVVAGVVSRTLRRHGRCDQELVRDLSQETFLKLMGDRFSLQRRAAGRSEGEIIGLVKTTTANLVLDALRALRPAAQLEEVIVSDANNEKIEVAVLIQEVDATLKKLLTPASASRDYRIFWFYHRDRMTAKEIALLPGINLSTKGVESVVFRLTADVKAAIGGRKGIRAKEPL